MAAAGSHDTPPLRLLSAKPLFAFVCGESPLESQARGETISKVYVVGGKMTWVHRIAFFLLSCLPASAFATGAPDDTLLDRLVALETRCDRLCSPADGKTDLRAQIETIAER